jgi:tRNA (guanine-N7-)-methyltransferase
MGAEPSPYSPLMLDLDGARDGDPVLDWGAVFGSQRPVELEIGIGKGRFLLDAAARHPEVSFVGVEWAGKYLRLAASRGWRRGLRNVRFARADGREFIEFFVPRESLTAIHVLFPDPWPKKRHHKRRLVSSEFLAEVERTLRPGGRLWLATDHAEYFEAMQEVLAGCCGLCPVDAEWVGARTNYEDRYLTQGKPIHRRVVQKASGATG